MANNLFLFQYNLIFYCIYPIWTWSRFSDRYWGRKHIFVKPIHFLDVQTTALYANTAEPYDHGKDTEEFYNLTKDFKEGMKKDQTVVNEYDVKMINKVHYRDWIPIAFALHDLIYCQNCNVNISRTYLIYLPLCPNYFMCVMFLYMFQALLPKAVVEQFESRKMSMNDSSMVVRLYYCGLLERPNRADEILKNGFSEEGTFLTFRYFPQWVFPIVNIFLDFN